MKKIVFIASSMGRGGAERVMSILTREYCSAGWDVDIVMILHNINEYPLHERVNVIDLSFEDIKNPIYRKLKMLLALREYLKTEKPQIVVPFLAKIAAVTEIAMCGMRRTFRVVTSERIDPYCANYSKLLRVMVNKAFHKADTIVFQSLRAKSYYSDIIQAKSRIIGNPISIDIKKAQKAQPIIISAGRLEPQKNQKMLIAAFASVANDFPEYKLHIYGEGTLRSELQGQIENLDMGERIFLKGNRLDYQDKLKEAEIFVLPSDFEGLSNALLEAMMIGIPCVSTDCAGSNEIIISEQNGLLCPIGDTDALAKALRCLLEDEQLRNRIAICGKESVQQFKTEKIISKWKAALEGIDEEEN